MEGLDFGGGGCREVTRKCRVNQGCLQVLLSRLKSSQVIKAVSAVILFLERVRKTTLQTKMAFINVNILYRREMHMLVLELPPPPPSPLPGAQLPSTQKVCQRGIFWSGCSDVS